MKKLILPLIISLVVAACPLAALCATYYSIENQYGASYLGELESYYNKLKNADDKKIVVVGGSNIAFGLDVDVMEEVAGYDVTPMGLYATLGTKLMMDLSIDSIKEGDIVVISPEISSQSMSMYFNPEITLQALGGKSEICSHIKEDNRREMLYKTPKYISDNYSLFTGKTKINLSGVYQKSSFNDNCNMIFDKPTNIMKMGYDPTMTIEFSTFEFNDDFFKYLNDFAISVLKKKAYIYFAFSPMNEMAVVEKDEQIITDFYNTLQSKIVFPIISSPLDYIMDYRYFYDSNFHLNNTGAAIRTKYLVEDLYRALEINDLVHIQIPPLDDEKPDEGDDKPDEGEVDHITRNQDQEDWYTFVEYGNGIAVNGVKPDYKTQKVFHVPSTIGGVDVVGLLANSFADCPNMVEVHIYNPMSALLSGAFIGCDKLERVYIHTKADDIIVSIDGGLLEGCNPMAFIYVYSDYFADFATNYFWGNYIHKLKKIE